MFPAFICGNNTGSIVICFSGVDIFIPFIFFTSSSSPSTGGKSFFFHHLIFLHTVHYSHFHQVLNKQDHIYYINIKFILLLFTSDKSKHLSNYVSSKSLCKSEALLHLFVFSLLFLYFEALAY